MRALLVSPRGTCTNQQNNFLNAIYRKLMAAISFIEIEDIEFMPNLGLLTIASLFPPEWELEYVEEDYIDEETREDVVYDERFDLVCLTGVNTQAMRAYEIADAFRARGVTVVIGGLHASAMPEEAKEHCDAVFVGEGEETFPVFLQDLAREAVQPFYRAQGIADLTKLPPPRYDLVKNVGRFNKISLFATRGCPHRCGFCCLYPVYGATYRHKTAAQVAAEIEEIKKLYPRPFISFADENMLVDRAFALELADAIASCGVRWEGYCDISVAQDSELLDRLHRSGCVLLMIGLETLRVGNLAEVSPWKSRMIARYASSVEAIQSHGIGVMGLFMLGFDDDDRGTFDEIRSFIRQTSLFDVDFAIVCPIPGTKLFRELEEQGRIVSTDWNDYGWYNVNYRPAKLTAKELRDGIVSLFNEFNTPEMVLGRILHFQRIYSRLYPDAAERLRRMEELGLSHYYGEEATMHESTATGGVDDLLHVHESTATGGVDDLLHVRESTATGGVDDLLHVHEGTATGGVDDLLHVRDYRGALQRLDAAVEASPGDASLHRARGLLLDRMGRLEDAARSFEQAVRLAPGDSESWYELAEVCLKFFQTSRVKEICRLATERWPDDHRFAMVLADGWLWDSFVDTRSDAACNAAEAERLVSEALARRPGEGELHAVLAEAALLRRDYAGARERFEEAVRLGLAIPVDDVDISMCLGLLHLEAGDPVKARSCIEKSLALFEAWDEDHYHRLFNYREHLLLLLHAVFGDEIDEARLHAYDPQYEDLMSRGFFAADISLDVRRLVTELLAAKRAGMMAQALRAADALIARLDGAHVACVIFQRLKHPSLMAALHLVRSGILRLQGKDGAPSVAAAAAAMPWLVPVGKSC